MPVLASSCSRQVFSLFKRGVLNMQMADDDIRLPQGRGSRLRMAFEGPGYEVEVDKQSRQESSSAFTPGDGGPRFVKLLQCSVDALLWEGRGAV